MQRGSLLRSDGSLQGMQLLGRTSVAHLHMSVHVLMTCMLYEPFWLNSSMHHESLSDLWTRETDARPGERLYPRAGFRWRLDRFPIYFHEPSTLSYFWSRSRPEVECKVMAISLMFLHKAREDGLIPPWQKFQ